MSDRLPQDEIDRVMREFTLTELPDPLPGEGPGRYEDRLRWTKHTRNANMGLTSVKYQRTSKAEIRAVATGAEVYAEGEFVVHLSPEAVAILAEMHADWHERWTNPVVK